MRFNRFSPRGEEDNYFGILEEQLDSDAIDENWYWLQMSEEEEL